MQHQDSEMLIDLTSDSDCTMTGDSDGAQELPFVDLTMCDEERVSDSEKCAENGWIEILETPNGLYDYDNDPAGLYGGREVDDRPSLLEFYHQDARSNGIFARMAPKKQDLITTTAAKASQILPDFEDETANNDQLLSKFPPLKVQRSYAEVLSKTGVRPQSSSKEPALRSYSTQKKSTKEKALLVLDAWQKESDARNKSKEDTELQKAIDISKAMKEKEDSEFQKAILASRALEDINQAKFQDAVRASLAMESSKRKREGSNDCADDGLNEGSNFQKGFRSSITPKAGPGPQKASRNCSIDRVRPSKAPFSQSSSVQGNAVSKTLYQGSPLEPFLWSQSRIH